jgi:hypothetical protein
MSSDARFATQSPRNTPVQTPLAAAAAPRPVGSDDLARALAEVKGQAQFLLYLADQVDDCLQQLASETDTGNAAFLCRLMSMYSSQLETKHQGLGEKIAETCNEVYAAIRELDLEE